MVSYVGWFWSKHNGIHVYPCGVRYTRCIVWKVDNPKKKEYDDVYHWSCMPLHDITMQHLTVLGPSKFHFKITVLSFRSDNDR
jgi:hypothetical protein